MRAQPITSSTSPPVYICRGIYSNLKDYGDKWYYEPQFSGNPKFYTSSKRPDASISSYTLWRHETIRPFESQLGGFRFQLL